MPRYYDIKIFDVKLNAMLLGMEIADLVEQTIATWSVERPDLDFTAMSTALKVNLLVTKQLELTNQYMLELGVTLGEFDVLATLRRHGKNGVLMPTEIAVFAMITPSGLTNRLSRLEKMGHIVRLSDPNDRRISLVRITAKGRRIADLGIEFAAQHSTDILDGVKPADLAVFTRVIDQLALNVENQTSSTAQTGASSK
ncbi:MarR family transcriptional regulator [bacterium]|nr:MarR family transcriptional regulator [bacterium]